MNLFGNSLKFTSVGESLSLRTFAHWRVQNGYIHVSLKQLFTPEDIVNNTVKIELRVSDTGKGISPNFLKVSPFIPRIDVCHSYTIIRITYSVRSRKRTLCKPEPGWDLQS
jgi:hypothetical protein